MIVPSIDISGGRAVQLVGGETVAIEAGDPRPLLELKGSLEQAVRPVLVAGGLTKLFRHAD